MGVPAHPPERLQCFRVHLKGLPEDGLVVNDSIPKTSEGVRAPVNITAPLAACCFEPAVQGRTPKVLIVSWSKQANPEREFQLGNNVIVGGTPEVENGVAYRIFRCRKKLRCSVGEPISAICDP